MMEYRIARDRHMSDFVKEVEELIASGYRPTGGIAVIVERWTNERKGYEESATWYYQAMIKE